MNTEKTTALVLMDLWAFAYAQDKSARTLREFESACLLAERIGEDTFTPLNAEALSRFLPYTCLAGADPDTLAPAYAAELSQDPVYREYQSLFGIC